MGATSTIDGSVRTLGRYGLVALTLALLAGMLTTVPVARAGEASVSTSLGSLSVEVKNATFEVTGCQTVTIRVVASAPSDIDWTVRLHARLRGTAPYNTVYVFGSGTSVETDGFYLCPSYGAGQWLVSGTALFEDYAEGKDESADLETSFRLRKARTHVRLTKAKRLSQWTEISGRVTSRSPQWGVVGAPGPVTIQARTGRRWNAVGTASAESTGRFTARVFESYPRGTAFRAVFDGSDATAPSRSRPRLL